MLTDGLASPKPMKRSRSDVEEEERQGNSAHSAKMAADDGTFIVLAVFLKFLT